MRAHNRAAYGVSGQTALLYLRAWRCFCLNLIKNVKNSSQNVLVDKNRKIDMDSYTLCVITAWGNLQLFSLFSTCVFREVVYKRTLPCISCVTINLTGKAGHKISTCCVLSWDKCANKIMSHTITLKFLCICSYIFIARIFLLGSNL